ncbi:MAG TPA: hypothetical protein PKE12_02430 [Kiritimatiellia bacterium]|nr:hypothetical protein [Kiritimatiellia bacterium]
MKQMRILLALLGLAACCAQAAPPVLLNHQGRLLDSLGDPLSTSVPMAIRLFTVETGGTHVWEQELVDVQVYRGLYSVQYGDAALSDVLTNSAVWLEVEVDGETLSPRRLLVSVPYALRAAVADELEGALAGFPSGGIALWSGSIASIPEGWALCDGSNGSPDLRDRFVMGAPAGQDPGATGGAHSLTLTASQMPAHTHGATAATAGAHTHSASTGSAGNHSHSASTGSAGNHSHTVSSDNSYGSSLTRPGGGVGGSQTSQGGSVNSVSHTHSRSSISSGGAHTHTVTINSAGNHTHTVSVDSTGDGAAIDNRPAFYAMAFIFKL